VLLGFLPAVPSDVTEAVLMALLADGRISRLGAVWHVPTHRPVLSGADQEAWRRIEILLDEAGLRPPRLRELADALQISPLEMDLLLMRLERFGHLLRVAPNRCFLPRTVIALAKLAETLAAEAEAGGFTAATFNQRSGVGRNLAIEILEYLDRTGVTQRIGDLRHVLRAGADVF
jgi:selenocysteine-specific elongation factor